MVNEHQEAFPENDVPNPPRAGSRSYTEDRPPGREGLRREDSSRSAPPPGIVRPEVEEGVVKLSVEQFTTMMGILLAAMGGAGRGGTIPPPYSLGRGGRENRDATHMERGEEERSNGVARGAWGVDKAEQANKTQNYPEVAGGNEPRNEKGGYDT